MDSKVIKDIFETSGYEFLYEKFKYQFYVSGLFDTVKNGTVIECFLDKYNFEKENRILFDDFVFHFKIFHNLYVKNKLIRNSFFH
ncbi:hypothetical protein ELQ35_13685 [Peribacillus cavernae]|uniref:Uncharacterized protein n=1 Tax=Peribacillus cavernae TaxID=1674310 RepID=A0A433HIR6_9BACI|nr:hypothetical protein [Peribacillus cavernae]MDQ0217828.1 hypothetical protein [Peribacillus cavernae]RUQ28274.1 hypothetical protein ELQ35_13685 [Peribacillus cavernae]